MHVPQRSRRGFFPSGHSGTSRRLAGSLAALVTAAGLLTACGDNSGKTTLVWYINPDAGGQAAIAETCSTDQYTITTQTLPQDANQQRVQLARRLEAHDSGIDLMSIDPPYTAEFANAGFLATIPTMLQDKLKTQSFKGAVDAATLAWPPASGLMYQVRTSAEPEPEPHAASRAEAVMSAAATARPRRT